MYKCYNRIMRIINNNELSSFKVLPFDIYTENRTKILEAGEVLTPGKIIMLKNYPKIYTEDFVETGHQNNIDSSNTKKTPGIENFTFDSIDISDFETVINQNASVEPTIQVKIKYFFKKIMELFENEYYEQGLIKPRDVRENIYVNSYTRSDGTQVSGYYRSR